MTTTARRQAGKLRQKPPSPARPWARVPPEMATKLQPALPATIASVVEAVEAEVAEYRVDPNDPVQLTLLAGVKVALERLLGLLGTDEEALTDVADLYDRIGAFEYQARRPLEEVLSAYRVGATTTWRNFSRAAVESGASPGDVAALAEACFTYINEIASTSTAGYARAQAADEGARSRARSQLVSALLNGDMHSSSMPDLSRRVRWPIPSHVVAVLLGDQTPSSVLARLNEAQFVVAAHTEVGQIAVCRAPLSTSERQSLERTISDHRATIGTVQPAAKTADSLETARVLAVNRDRWGLPDSGVAWAEAHIPALLLSADPSLGEELRQHSLGPLLALPQDRRQPLMETLRWWLLLQGSRQRVAEIMTLHPQTISYRMDRVRALLGEELEKPDTRWAILLALMTESPEI